MNKIEPFYYEESKSNPGKYCVRVKHDEFFCTHTTGSFNVLPARVMELDYASYLRMCRDVLGAEIVGKNHLYPVAYFSNTILLSQLVKLLNARANVIAWQRTYDKEKAEKMRKAVKEKENSYWKSKEAYNERHKKE